MKIDKEINVFDNLKKAKKKEYRLKNKEHINKYMLRYRLNNKNKISKTTKAYYLKNCDNIKEYSKNYRLNNPDRIKEYHLNNKDKKKKYLKEYRLKNKEKGKEYKRLYILNNRNLINANTAKRRASKLNATPKFANIKKIQKDLKWHPTVSFEDGVGQILDNIDYWKSAPLWTKSNIERETKLWFRYLK